MAMKEIEAMYNRIDQINNESVKAEGRDHPHYHELLDHIGIQVDYLRKGFTKGIDSGRDIMKAARMITSGRIGIDEFKTLQDRALIERKQANLTMETAMKELNNNAELLGVPAPQGNHKDAQSFTKELMFEYDSLSEDYEKAYARAVEHGVPFILNEHTVLSKEMMSIANECIQEVRSAMKDKVLPNTYFDGFEKYKHISARECLVRDSLGGIAQDLKKERVKGVIDIIRHDTKKKDSVYVPALYVPDKNVYIISEKDFKEKIQSAGTPITPFVYIKLRKEKFDPDSPECRTEIKAKKMSLMKTCGYSGKDTEENRRNAIKTILDEGILYKEEMMQYFQMRINMAQGKSPTADQRDALKSDAEFAKNYETKLEKSRQKKLKNFDIIK